MDDKQLTAWFTDAATRNPDIRHTSAKPRFFEMEWDEIIQSGAAMALPHFALVLEDYEDGMNDNGHDYISGTMNIAFLIIRTVPPGKRAMKKETYAKARKIARDILAKLHSDADAGPCDADVPNGITPPVKVLLSTMSGQRIGPVPAFDQAFGYRLQVTIRVHDDPALDMSGTQWLALPQQEEEQEEQDS